MVEILENRKGLARAIYSAEGLCNLLQFARAARASSVDHTNGAISFVSDRVQFITAGALSRWITGSQTPGRLLLSTKRFMDAIKDSKAASNAAQRLVKLRPDSQEAQVNTKVLMRALRGSTVTVLMPNGSEREAEIK